MKLLLALALAGRVSASWDPIAFYVPETNVVPHSKIDLDQQEINEFIKTDVDAAMFVYENGGGGLCTQEAIDAAAETDPCFEATTESAAGNSVKGSGAIRTLQGFAKSGRAKMASEKWWPIYRNYWDDDNYADTFVQKAFNDATMDPLMKGELIKKGVAYQANWMYVLHEFEDAIADCAAGNIFDNDVATAGGDAPHAWDEGWAFYAGSLEGVGDPIGTSGAQLWNVAQKRCGDFGTCAEGTDSSTIAHANKMALQYAELGRDKILQAKCKSVSDEFDLIVSQMTVPLVQGTLKYAFKSDKSNPTGSCAAGCPKEWAEGWAFAAAILPQLNYCDQGVAAAVRENLDAYAAEPMSTMGFQSLKEMIERTYPCLGITCDEVGEYQNAAGVYEGMGKCTDATAAIAGYHPQTDVVPHSKIDLDQQEINTAAGAADFEQAIFVYEKGGGGLCSEADIATTDDSNSCFGKTTADARGNSVKGSGAIRTIQGFATSGEAKMSEETWWPVYSKYWGDNNYADSFVMDAYNNADMDPAMKTELIKKGTPYQGVWMYVLHEFEDAIADCRAGNIYDNDLTPSGDAPHAWDEGWAFYAGSLEGPVGGSDGVLLYNLAQKRCARMGTCAQGAEGTARANIKALSAAILGRDSIISENCDDAVVAFENIVHEMKVPLIQGIIEYAYKADPLSDYDCKHKAEDGRDCLKEWAEGWAFAAGVLPMIDQCDPEVAKTVAANLGMADGLEAGTQVKDGYVAVKEAVESTYNCLGLTCDEIGQWGVDNPPPGLEKCDGSPGPAPEPPTNDDPPPTPPPGKKKKSKEVDEVPIIIICVVAAVLLLASICLFMKWRATESKLYELSASQKHGNSVI
jgi:hypothetical protein